MRLYLSSHGFGNHIDRLFSMVGSNKKVLFIDNAKDYILPAERAQHVIEKREEFEAAGFEFEELDLRNYFGKPSELASLIDTYAPGLIWIGGGNTFVLRRALSYSGLSKILPAALREDKFVYGGASAGSIIATKTLRGTQHGDDPYTVPDGYKPEILWTGLKLIYLQLVPHYESSWPQIADQAEAMADYFEDHGLTYATLRDGDVYIVDGEFEEKLT